MYKTLSVDTQEGQGEEEDEEEEEEEEEEVVTWKLDCWLQEHDTVSRLQ